MNPSAAPQLRAPIPTMTPSSSNAVRPPADRIAGRLLDQAAAQEDLTRRSDSPVFTSAAPKSTQASVSGFRTAPAAINKGKGVAGDKDAPAGAGQAGDTKGIAAGPNKDGTVDSITLGQLKITLPPPKPKVCFLSVALFI